MFAQTVMDLFDTSDFPPRWECGNWTELHGWLHVLADLGVWSAYVTIPCVLAYFVARRRDIPFQLIFVLFAAFILACGTTHLMEAIIFWWPAYRLAGLIKILTALVSWGTVFALIRITPRALTMRTAEELEREIEQRNYVEAELRSIHVELEKRVQSRTAELAQANDELRREVELRKQVEARLDHQVHQRTQELREEVAERHAAVEALQRSEAMFQGLFRFAPDAILVTDVDGKIRQANLQSENLLGCTQAEILGQAVENFIPVRFQDDHRRHRAVYSTEPHLRPMGLGRELYARRHDGTEIPVDVMLAPLDTPDGALVLANLRDITHRKANEQIIRTRAAQGAVLAEFSQQALDSSDLEAFLNEAVATIARTLNADLCRFLAIPAPGNIVIARAGFGWKAEHLGKATPITDDVEFCLLAGHPVIVSDLRSEKRFRASPDLVEHGAVSGIETVVKGNLAIHGVLGIHTRQPRQFTSDDVVFLQTFASLLAAIIDRTQVEQQVRASLAEKEVLLKEVHHRVKNNLQIISSLLDLQSEHTSDPATVEMFRESQNRVRSMAIVHERLYRSGDLARVDFGAYVESLTDHLLQTYRIDQKRIRLEMQVDPSVRLPIDAAVPCALLLNELVSNCLKHAFTGRERGTVKIELRRVEDERIELTVQDDGVGLPENLDIAKADTFGLQLVWMLSSQLKSELVIERQGGTTYRLRFRSANG